jgi:L-ascorbate metabolism protein UlaG (beta-lactamase superfamily)
MKITKFGHSCLLVEEGEARIMIDPGNWNKGHTEVKDLDAIFITHKHGDHAKPEDIKMILSKNNGVKIYSNDHVLEEMAKHDIKVERFVGGETKEIKGVSVEAHGQDHAVIYPSYPRTDNTCYLVGGRLYHPGDSLHNPGKPAEILALPIIAPWMKVSEAIDFGKEIKPKFAFGIHDGMLRESAWLGKHPKLNLEPMGVEWKDLETGVAMVF